MSDVSPYANLTDAQLQLIHDVCGGFEDSLLSGNWQPIESLVESVDAQLQRRLFGELLAIEIELRAGNGEAPQPAEYEERFPEWTSDIRQCFSDTHLQGTTQRGRGRGEDPVAALPFRVSPAATFGAPDRIGRYRLERKLGEGTFGVVWLAFDSELRRQVALKVPAANRFRRPEDVESYLVEAQMVASLDHPNIVPVYDVGRDERSGIYVVSKFIEGSDLGRRIRERRPDFEESARLLATVARALEYSHQKQLIHRDIKPANILIEDATGCPYVADFGLAITENDFDRQPILAGTPAYMSPEQARSEGHRLDGRSDIFSLGVVLYELLTDKRPFHGTCMDDLLRRVVTEDPVPPHEHDAAIPSELERICLKALSKRASERYGTAAEMADDLLNWRQGARCQEKATRIVPRGLRSFDADDADFYLELLPGPRDRDGLPQSIRFWKTRIEETDPDKTFPVGLIYGPSGCGKSSLMRAALLPRLSHDVTSVYVEATGDETELRLIRGLRRQIPDLPGELGLSESFTWLRRQQGHRIVVVLDQFEQWLHAHRDDMETELVSALRQCDGGRVQTIVMLRDDFAMAAVRFMKLLDIPIVQSNNFAVVDLFDQEHALKVLSRFGTAFGRLPEQATELSDEQRHFLADVTSGLAEDGKVVSVRLALFAEMVKTKDWVPATLKHVGGTQGIGVNFLEETFSSRSANPDHVAHEAAARRVLAALLPDSGTNLKGHLRSRAELANAAELEPTSRSFNQLLRILDGELRLITPTDPETPQPHSGSTELTVRYFQLTHDYLVPSLREWLTRKQRQTRSGRAEICLAERASLWNAMPQNRHLPSFSEWASIRGLTDKTRWAEPEAQMMRKANRVHTFRAVTAIAIVGVMIAIGTGFTQFANERQRAAESSRLVDGLLKADTSQLASILKELEAYRRWADPELQARFDAAPDKSTEKLHSGLALLSGNDSLVSGLGDRLLSVRANEFSYVRDLLADYRDELTARYWVVVEDPAESESRRFTAACALASYAPNDERWNREELGQFVADHLVNVLPSELPPWRNALRDVRHALTDELATIYRNETLGERSRSFATDCLVDYAQGDAELLSHLLVDGDDKAFAALFPVLEDCGAAAVGCLTEVLNRTVEHSWNDAPLKAGVAAPDEATRIRLEEYGGLLHDRFAIAAAIPRGEFEQLAEQLRVYGYRPTRARSYRGALLKYEGPASKVSLNPINALGETLVAATWTRDAKRWELQTDVTLDQIPPADSTAARDGLVPTDISAQPVADASKEPRFVLLWGEPDVPEERRRVVADVDGEQLKAHVQAMKKDGFIAQCTIDMNDQPDWTRRYAGIWSNHGALSELNDGYPGFEMPHRPQWDVSAVAMLRWDNPRDVLHRRLEEWEDLSDGEQRKPQVRLQRCRARYHLGRLEETLQHLESWVGSDDCPAEALALQAWALARVGSDNSDGVMARYLEAETAPHQRAYSEVVMLAWLGKYRDATDRLNAAIVEAEHDVERLYTLARAACVLFQAALASGQSESEAAPFADQSLELVERVFANGFTDLKRMETEVDFASLHSDVRFQAILHSAASPRYGAVWRADTQCESKLLGKLSSDDFMEQWTAVAVQAWRPVSIAVSHDGRVSSIWHRPVIPDAEKEKVAKQKATAATALLRMGNSESMRHLYQHQPDPRCRSYLVHQSVPHEVDVRLLIDMLGNEPDVSIRRALLLAIGTHAAAGDVSPENDGLAEQLLKLYADDRDPGIHGAAEWALRQLGVDAEIATIQDTFATGAPVDERRWFLTKQGSQPLAVIDTQDIFLMSSPVTEAGRFQGPTGINELRHRRRIGRTFAIGTCEVTVEDFLAFRPDYDLDRATARELDAPANKMSWYDAAAYCNWLSDQEGIPRDQWCYDPDQKPGNGMKMLPDYLERSGYRLPTEAEWEFACRAGSNTSRHFGETVELMQHYGWYVDNSKGKFMLPVGSLMPNDFGLFDMHGNAMEWSQDAARLFTPYREWYSDESRSEEVIDSLSRIFRGGSLGSNNANIRTSCRLAGRAGGAMYNGGFRIARTLP